MGGIAVGLGLFGDQHDRAVGVGEERGHRQFADLGDLADALLGPRLEGVERAADGQRRTDVMLLRLVEAPAQLAHHFGAFHLLGHLRRLDGSQPRLVDRVGGGATAGLGSGGTRLRVGSQ